PVGLSRESLISLLSLSLYDCPNLSSFISLLSLSLLSNATRKERYFTLFQHVFLSRPGESAVWRSLNYEEATTPQPPSPSSPYQTVLDLVDSPSPYDKKTSFKGTPPDHRDATSWWSSAYGIFRVGLERAKEKRGSEVSPRCMGARPNPEKDKEFKYWTFDEADEKARLLG
ncbi:amp-binding enzyme domain-containing protein, partial [Cystoisospora suis]